ncbi:hypothetical protein HPY42_00555 [Coprothermobacteraceae bacterium]|nr:hypothetical protein [Coprothermobacteraceae bacterium]
MFIDPMWAFGITLAVAFFASAAKYDAKVMRALLSLTALFNVLVFATNLSRAYYEGTFTVTIGGFAPPTGIGLQVSMLGALIALLTNAALLAVLLTLGKNRTGRFYTLLAIYVLGVSGMSLTGDYFNFFVMMELAALSTAAVMAAEGTRGAKAAFKYLMYAEIGAAFYLVGVAVLYAAAGTLNFAHLAKEVGQASTTVKAMGMLALFVGMSAEAELLPLALWVPEGYKEAPAELLALLPFGFAAGMTLIARLAAIFGLQSWVSVVAWATILYGAVAAWQSKNFRESIGYLSMAEAGIVLVALLVGANAAFAAILLTAVLGEFAMLILADGGVHAGRTAGLLLGMLALVGFPLSLGFVGEVGLLFGGLWLKMPATTVVVLVAILVKAVVLARWVSSFAGAGFVCDKRVAASLVSSLVLFIAGSVIMVQGLYDMLAVLGKVM